MVPYSVLIVKGPAVGPELVNFMMIVFGILLIFYNAHKPLAETVPDPPVIAIEPVIAQTFAVVVNEPKAGSPVPHSDQVSWIEPIGSTR